MGQIPSLALRAAVAIPKRPLTEAQRHGEGLRLSLDRESRRSWRAFRFLAPASPCLSGSVRTLAFDRCPLAADERGLRLFDHKGHDEREGGRTDNSFECCDIDEFEYYAMRQIVEFKLRALRALRGDILPAPIARWIPACEGMTGRGACDA